MKVAQMLATIPEALPPEYAEASRNCKARRRRWARLSSDGACRRNLGPDWQEKFAAFDLQPAAAASLGQVHRARSSTAPSVACKLQYPDMASAVEADLAQLE